MAAAAGDGGEQQRQRSSTAGGTSNNGDSGRTEDDDVNDDATRLSDEELLASAGEWDEAVAREYSGARGRHLQSIVVTTWCGIAHYRRRPFFLWIKHIIIEF